MRRVALALAVCLGTGGSVRAQGDWGATRSGFDAGVVKRYKQILARDPHDAAALRALVAIYKRYKTVDLLVSEYTEAGETWDALIVLAHMPTTSREDAIGFYQRALSKKPDDGRGWMALGEALRDAAAARTAFQRALDVVTTPGDRRRAWTGLLAAARALKDAPTIDAAYAGLLSLAPKSEQGRLWLDRGDAQLAANHPADAHASFVTAEGLLRTDPERKLTAMTSQGHALARQARTDEAIAQWEKTLDAVPRGYFLGGEIVAYIIDAERKRGRLAEVTTRLETRWKLRARGYLEWATLADLYLEQKDQGRALDALKQAVKKAPTEMTTQRKLIALYDTLGLPADALAQHEAAAKLAPGDADMQIDLARRYIDKERGKALDVLARLSVRMRANVNVRVRIAKQYDEWSELARAAAEYEAVADLEPGEKDHALVLGEIYWRLEDVGKARAAWARLAKIGTLEALLSQGEVLLQHEQWENAIEAFTSAATKDATSPDPWRGRARALDELGRYEQASIDARRAVALIGLASDADGLRERSLLARVLGHDHDRGSPKNLEEALRRWQFAFDHGDNAAGYMLATHLGRVGSPQRHSVLVELYRRVPGDDSLGISVARSYARRQEYRQARGTLETILRRSPALAKDIEVALSQLARDEERAEIEARWAEQGKPSRSVAKAPDLVGGGRRWGSRFVIGSDVRNTQSAVAGVGLVYASPLATGTAFAFRFDSLQRDAAMAEVGVLSTGIGLQRRILDARKLEVAVEATAAFELRFNLDDEGRWGRAAIAGEGALILMPRAIPATLGLRWSQNLTDDGRGSTLSVELGFEVR